MSSSEKIDVENINCPGQVSRVDVEKYQAMRKALLQALPPVGPGFTQQEMFDAIQPYLPQNLWPGGSKSAWWCKTVQLDLEAKALVKRTSGKPLRWYVV